MDWTLTAGLGSLILIALIGGVALWRAFRRPRPVAVAQPAAVTITATVPALEAEALPEDTAPSAAEVMSQLFLHALGRTEPDAPDPQLYAQIEAPTEATLRDVAAQPRYLPRRPQLLPQLLSAVNDDGASMRDIARIIGQDPALTGNLLRIANSPAYRVQPDPVESIERAVALLGTRGIRSTIAAAVLQPVLSSGGAFAQFPEAIWNHTLRAAAAAEAHAVIVGNDDPFAAQLLGLLHGLGTIVVFRVARDEFAEHPDAEPSALVISRLVETHAAPTAARIATAWELSDRVIAALEQQQEDVDPATVTPLAQALRFGRVAAALALLTEAGRLSQEEALTQLPGRARYGSKVDRIWERLTRPPGVRT
jgi:HD-like signal output (HDOD) protein